MLIMVVPYQRSARRQRFHVYFWSVTILLVYSVLVVFTKVKNRRMDIVQRPTNFANAFSQDILSSYCCKFCIQNTKLYLVFFLIHLQRFLSYDGEFEPLEGAKRRFR
jgi:NADH:ubiquinone oxidoreductase subunit 6 (subunit J)